MWRGEMSILDGHMVRCVSDHTCYMWLLKVTYSGIIDHVVGKAVT